MNRTLLTTTLALATLTLAAASAPAHLAAQLDTVVVMPTNPKADRLAEQAERMAERGRWLTAAETYHRSANVRAVDDPRASGAYETAANLYYFAGSLDASRATMVMSGDRALQRGDIVQAALAYLGAGWVAGRQRDERAMIELTDRARRLANSPLLTATDRERILRRAGDTGTLTASTTP